jgi:hypothetical protein
MSFTPDEPKPRQPERVDDDFDFSDVTHRSDQPTMPMPPTHLVRAILVTVCCCLPFGVPAIVYAAGVESKYRGGDFRGAARSSRNAELWIWIAVVIGLCFHFIRLTIEYFIDVKRFNRW